MVRRAPLPVPDVWWESPVDRVDDVRRRLDGGSLLDPARAELRRGASIHLPVVGDPAGAALQDLPGRMVPEVGPRHRARLRSIGRFAPVLRWPAAELRGIPLKWERYGDIVVLPTLSCSPDRVAALASAFATVLGVRGVLEDLGGGRGELRRPQVRLLWGEARPTEHVEDGVRFRLDPSRVMFSSGNLPERQRIARLPRPGEVVVDLCAGVGAFTLPMAVHSAARRIIACEKNPDAAALLREGIDLNRVGDRVELREGDCRDVAPAGVADRVVLGYVQGSRKFLEAAFRALRPGASILHYHEVYELRHLPERLETDLGVGAAAAGRSFSSIEVRPVKWFAPRVRHIVADCFVAPVTREGL